MPAKVRKGTAPMKAWPLAPWEPRKGRQYDSSS